METDRFIVETLGARLRSLQNPVLAMERAGCCAQLPFCSPVSTECYGRPSSSLMPL